MAAEVAGSTYIMKKSLSIPVSFSVAGAADPLCGSPAGCIFAVAVGLEVHMVWVTKARMGE
jgi:hypothetical protein